MHQGAVFDNEVMRLENRDGIVYGWYKEGNVTLDLARQIVSDRKVFTNGQPVMMLVMSAGLKGIERDARSYLSSKEGVEGIIAAAIISKNTFEKHLANFFIHITVIRPKIPTKLFSNEASALDWLKTLQKKSA